MNACNRQPCRFGCANVNCVLWTVISYEREKKVSAYNLSITIIGEWLRIDFRNQFEFNVTLRRKWITIIPVLFWFELFNWLLSQRVLFFRFFVFCWSFTIHLNSAVFKFDPTWTMFGYTTSFVITIKMLYLNVASVSTVNAVECHTKLFVWKNRPDKQTQNLSRHVPKNDCTTVRPNTHYVVCAWLWRVADQTHDTSTSAAMHLIKFQFPRHFTFKTQLCAVNK